MRSIANIVILIFSSVLIANVSLAQSTGDNRIFTVTPGTVRPTAVAPTAALSLAPTSAPAGSLPLTSAAIPLGLCLALMALKKTRKP